MNKNGFTNDLWVYRFLDVYPDHPVTQAFLFLESFNTLNKAISRLVPKRF
jgi:hypothetical protein